MVDVHCTVAVQAAMPASVLCFAQQQQQQGKRQNMSHSHQPAVIQHVFH